MQERMIDHPFSHDRVAVHHNPLCFTPESMVPNNGPHAEQMDLKGVGARIHSLRQSKGLSQEELADLVGVDQSTISHWESGHHSPDVMQIMRLLEVLGASTTDIIPSPRTE